MSHNGSIASKNNPVDDNASSLMALSDILNRLMY